MNNKYYIYFHINPLKNEIFYVGKGKDNRAFIKTGRSRYWNNIVKKYGYIIDITDENLTEEEAFEKEVFYINRIGRKSLGLGPLINMTDGGEGCSGLIFTDELRLKKSKSMMGKNTGKLSEEHKEKMSKAKKGKTSPNKGKTFSEDHKRKMSESKMGKPSPNKGKKYKRNKNKI